jgi:hypothetical protein
MIKKEWTPEEADKWTKEDWAGFLSLPIFICFGAGLALALLGQLAGFLMLAIGAGLTIAMFAIIIPKISATSGEYEKKQKEYIGETEKTERWQK